MNLEKRTHNCLGLDKDKNTCLRYAERCPHRDKKKCYTYMIEIKPREEAVRCLRRYK